MTFAGIQKLTLLDFPGHTACTIFTEGCNLRCPFCHNASLVLRQNELPELSEDGIFDFLSTRRDLLDGVCITGGEPTLHWDLPAFVYNLKTEGFLVKLDTNGTNPDMLSSLLSDGLLDYVAMDIKTSPARYPVVTGKDNIDVYSVLDSVDMLMRGKVQYEFRTTVVRELHREDDFHAIGEMIRGAAAYYLQGFKDSGDLIGAGLSPCTRDEMERFKEIVSFYVPNTEIRGVD